MSTPLPDGWLAYRVGDVGNVVVGQQKRTGAAGLEPYLRVANVQDAFLDLDDVHRMPFDDGDRYVLEPGDILLCEGQSREWVGRSAMYRGESSPLRFQNHLVRFRPGPSIVPEYALQVFRTYQRTGVFARISKATTGIAHLGMGRFKNLPFPLPPKEIQLELAEHGTNLQLLIDQTTTLVKSIESTMEYLAPAAADHAILGDLADSWSGSKAGASAWPLSTAESVVEAGQPIVYGILKPGPHTEDGVPYVRGQDLRQWAINVDDLLRCSRAVADRYERSALQTNDVLLGIIRSTRVAIVPETLQGANITQGTARFRAGPSVDARYLAHWLSSRAAQEWLRSHMRGIDMPGLNLRDVRRLPVPVPPIDQQRVIAKRLTALVERVADLKESLTKSQRWLGELETMTLRSITYGEAASRVTRSYQALYPGRTTQVTLNGPEDVPSDQIYEALFGGHESDAALPAEPEEVKSVSVPVSGAHAVTMTQLLAELARLGGSSSPEELYSELGLSESGVDSFYIAIRAAATAGKISYVPSPGPERCRLDLVEL